MKLSTIIRAFLISVLLSGLLISTTFGDDFEDFDILELLDIKVVTASKSEQTIDEAPAIIDVITKEQVAAMDVHNLNELVSYLPGVEMMETYYGKTVLNFRGVMNLHYQNKALIMVNSNPVFEATNGSGLIEMIPIRAIERIEVIRGPGSSLYGTNAYAGVINIITREGQPETATANIGVGFGSFNTIQAELSGNVPIGKKAGLFTAAEVDYNDGYPFVVDADESGNKGGLDYEKDIVRLFGNVSSGSLSMDVGFYRQKKSQYGITPNLNYTGHRWQYDLFANARYHQTFSDQLQTSFMVRLNHFDMPRNELGYFPYPGFAGHDTSQVHMDNTAHFISAELQVNSNWSGNVTNITGLVYEYQKSSDYLFVWDDDETTHPLSAIQESKDNMITSMYSEFNYLPFEGMNVNVGARLIYDQDIDDIFLAPRIGAIFHIRDDMHLKTLYGQAFRSPTIFEKNVETYNVLFGSTDLEAETIQTADMALEWGINDRHRLRLNGFMEQTDNIITRFSTPTPDEHGPNAAVYQNADEGAKIHGIEFSAEGVVTTLGQYGVNISWKDGTSLETDADLLNFAHIGANFWLHATINDWLSITPNAQYIGERDGYSSRQIAFTDFGPYTLDAYILLNVTATVKWDKVSLTLTGKNLLDKDYAYPEYVRGRSEVTPGGPERSFFASVQYRIF